MSKKLLSLFTILSVVLLFSSCEGPRGAEGPPGVGDWRIIYLDAKKGNWAWDKSAEVYYQEFDIPELTKFIAEEGAVMAAIESNKTFYPLPYTIYFYDENSKMYISETTSIDYGKGFVRVNIGALDLYDGTALNTQPPSKKIKLTLFW